MTPPGRLQPRLAALELEGSRQVWLNRLGFKWRDTPSLILFVLALLGFVCARAILDTQAPLWLDETWTGAIAGQSTWKATIDQIWLDANAPLYPVFMHGWIQLFGDSNAALRFPSFIFGLATPILIAGWRAPGLPTRERLALATLIALGQQGITQALDARCYTLLAFLATGQTFAFISLLARPSIGRAVNWVAWTDLVGLTHYQALVLGAVQGLIFLGRSGAAARRVWPAALGYLPLGVELLWHLPRLTQFARPDVAWYPMVSGGTVWQAIIFLVGNVTNCVIPGLGLTAVCLFAVIPTQLRNKLSGLTPRFALGVGAAITVFGMIAEGWRGLGFLPLAVFSRHRTAIRPWRSVSKPVLWGGVSAVIATVLVVGVGAVRPTFTLRYVTPFIPGVSLLLVVGARCLSSIYPAAMTAFLAVAVGGTMSWIADPHSHVRRPFTFEAASRDLMALHPGRLVFTWDHPAQKIEAVRQYDALGAFLFRRAGSPIKITSILLRRDEDPNQLLLASARDPDAVILWLYDLGVQGTAARRHRPRLTELDPSFGCRNYGRGSVGVLACAREWRPANRK